MSLQPQAVYVIPDETARVAHAAFPHGNPYLRLRDTFGMIYDDPMFAPLFARQGQPALAPFRLIWVLILQFAEHLTDRQAADAVRSRLDWKYLLALELTDPGFDASVLSEFRARLLAGHMEQHLLDTLLDLCRDQGLLTARGTQRTDSTHVLAAVRDLNRLECVGETLRQALNALASAAPDWLVAHVPLEWTERYGPRIAAARLPKSRAEWEALAARIGTDGSHLLQAIAAPTTPAALRALAAVQTLRQVWLQQYYAPDPQDTLPVVRWRLAADLPPAAQLIWSPYDVEARRSIKRDTTWTGYKVHVTETCDPEQVHLITQVVTTEATVPDRTTAPALLPELAARDLLPATHLRDAGYMDGDELVTAQTQYDVALIGPVAEDLSWQARAGAGFAAAQFRLDWRMEQAVCPSGKVSTRWTAETDRYGNGVVQISFAREDCGGCAVRTQCTKSTHRQLTLRPEAEYAALQAGRARQASAEYQEQYAQRAGIEGTLSQEVRRCDLRHSRYIGLLKTHLQHILIAVAVNLIRLAAWLDEQPHAKTRQSAFMALAPRLAPAAS